MTPPVFVLYHRNCSDGAGARFAAWLKFKEKATYLAVNYNEPLPQIEDGSDVYIVDFSYDRDTLLELHARVNTLVVLDHHKTAEEDLQGLDFAIFDKAECGATLAWKHFHPDKTLPEMFEYIRDYDLYQFKKKNSRAISAALVKYRDDNQLWETGCQHPDSVFPMLVSQGMSMLDAHDLMVEEIVQHAMVCGLFGKRVAIVNSSVLKDQVSERMQSDPKLNPDMTIVWYIQADGRMKMSLRSGGKTDVSKIAEAWGGGGNPTTAGVVTSPEEAQAIVRWFRENQITA